MELKKRTGPANSGSRKSGITGLGIEETAAVIEINLQTEDARGRGAEIEDERGGGGLTRGTGIEEGAVGTETTIVIVMVTVAVVVMVTVVVTEEEEGTEIGEEVVIIHGRLTQRETVGIKNVPATLLSQGDGHPSVGTWHREDLNTSLLSSTRLCKLRVKCRLLEPRLQLWEKPPKLSLFLLLLNLQPAR